MLMLILNRVFINIQFTTNLVAQVHNCMIVK